MTRILAGFLLFAFVLATAYVTPVRAEHDTVVLSIDIDDGVENVTQYIREMYPESKLVVVDHASNFVEVWAKISSVGDMY